MITKEDFSQSFRFISLGCKLGVLPLTVNLQNGELQGLQSRWKQAFCIARYILFTIHTTFIVLKLPYMMLAGVDVPLVSLLWHAIYAVALPPVVFWHYTAFFPWPGITVACFNQLFETWGGAHSGLRFRILSKIY